MQFDRTVLIVGGTAVVSLTIGGGVGYFIAKKKYENYAEQEVERELAASREYYEAIIAQLEEDLPEEYEDEEDTEFREEELEEFRELDTSEAEEPLSTDEPLLEKKDLRMPADAAQALTDYGGISTKKVLAGDEKPALSELVERNIFDRSKKSPLPPRRPGDSQHIPTHAVPEEADRELVPYIIQQEEFLQNPMDYEQETVLYFQKNKTAVMKHDMSEVDLEKLGEVNLTLFPQVPKDEPSIICVRNEGLEIEYEVQLMHEDLSEWMGFGDESEHVGTDSQSQWL